jgi:hypothetical protein
MMLYDAALCKSEETNASIWHIIPQLKLQDQGTSNLDFDGILRMSIAKHQ